MAAVLKDKAVKKRLSTLGDRFKSISRSTTFSKNITPIVFRDIQDHFRQQKGPDGRWPKLNPKYKRRRFANGFTGPILQKTGRLKNGFIPTNLRLVSRGYMWFNPVKYAKRHDEGINVPKRSFMWLSDKAMNLISKSAIFFLEGK